MKRVLGLSVIASLFAVNANAIDGEDEFQGWTIPNTGYNVTAEFNQAANCVIIEKEETGAPWNAQFNPPTWVGPGKEKWDIEIIFDAKYVGDGTDGDGVGYITLQQARQIGSYSGNIVEQMCARLGINEIYDSGPILQMHIEQLYVRDYTDAPDDFYTSLCNRNVQFYPTSEWQTFTVNGYLGRHGEDSVDLEFELGTMAGEYSIRNFRFKVREHPFASYFYTIDDAGLVYNNSQKTMITGYEGHGGDLIIPNGVISIADNAFKGCSTLTSVSIPESVESIGDEAFYNCTSLSSINFGGGVTSIGNSAFSDCSSLELLTIPNSVINIGHSVFSNCTSLVSVNIGNGVTSIGNSAFSGCQGLTEVTIPNSVTLIDNFAFNGCSRLTEVTIPNSVTGIGFSAFSGCSGLTSVTIPSSVTWIDVDAFSGCSGLTSVTIPSSVTWIGVDAFSGCSNLTELYIPNNENSAYLSDNGVLFNKDKTILICYPAGKTDVEYTIPESVTYIEGNAFYGCEGLAKLTIPNSVTGIGWNAFSGCIGLKAITTGDGVKSIDNIGLSSCSNLESITIGNSVESINSTFDGFKNLKSISFGSSVKNIGENIFEGCVSLESIVCNSEIPPEVRNNRFAANELDRVKLYANAVLTFPAEAKLYRKMQPWCNFDFAADANVEPRVDTIYKAVDTLYVINQEVAGVQQKIIYGIKATTADAKMGMAIGSGKYEKDEDAEIVAIEKYGYHFTKWSDGNTDNPRFVKVSADSTFKAEFEVNNYNVLAAANEKKMGRVEGTDTYAYLSRTQLKAVPNDGYKFTAWSDGETANPRNILVYSDTTFTAVFVATEATSIGAESAIEPTVYAVGGTIVVENAADEIRVYDAMGRLICRDAIHRVHNEMRVNAAGVYIVKVGNVAKRVMVN